MEKLKKVLFIKLLLLEQNTQYIEMMEVQLKFDNNAVVITDEKVNL